MSAHRDDTLRGCFNWNGGRKSLTARPLWSGSKTGRAIFTGKASIWLHLHAVDMCLTTYTIPKNIEIKHFMHAKKLTTKFYGVYVVLLCFPSNTIPTHDQGAIQINCGSDCYSWYNVSCYLFCDSKMKWVVRDHPTLTTRKKLASNIQKPNVLFQWLNVPLMPNRRNFTCECHILSRTWSFHTGLQPSTWNWRLTFNLNKQTKTKTNKKQTNSINKKNTVVHVVTIIIVVLEVRVYVNHSNLVTQLGC